MRLPCYPVATLQQIAWVTLSWGREGGLTSWGAFVPVDFSKDKGVTRDLSVFWSYTQSAFWIGPLKYFKNNELLKDAISCSMAEKKGGRGTRIIGECWHNNVRRDIMVIIATCPQWCRSKIKWDAEHTQSAVWRCILRAKTVYCRCSLRSLFYIKTEVGVEWNSTSLLVVFACCEDEMNRLEWKLCLGVDKYTTVNHSFQTFLRYGWMDKRFINTIWEIAIFWKTTAIFFSPKTNMQDEAGVPQLWLTTSCGF